MRIQHFQSLLVACLVTGTLWAANDPFVGKWKVNPSKSKLTDEMKVEVVGANKYAITFEPGAVDTIVADGTDQPALQGTTLSVTVDGPNHWKVVRKKRGPHDRHGALDAFWRRHETQRRLYLLPARRSHSEIAVCVRADCGELRIHGHMG